MARRAAFRCGMNLRFPPSAGAVAAAVRADLNRPVLFVTVAPLVPDALYLEAERHGADVLVALEPSHQRGRGLLISSGPYEGAESVVLGWMDAADADGYRVPT